LWNFSLGTLDNQLHRSQLTSRNALSSKSDNPKHWCCEDARRKREDRTSGVDASLDGVAAHVVYSMRGYLSEIEGRGLFFEYGACAIDCCDWLFLINGWYEVIYKFEGHFDDTRGVCERQPLLSAPVFRLNDEVEVDRGFDEEL